MSDLISRLHTHGGPAGASRARDRREARISTRTWPVDDGTSSERRGVETPCWHDPGIDWSHYDVALLRSTWTTWIGSTSSSPGAITAHPVPDC